MPQNEFLEKARRELTAKELGGLRVYEAQTDKGSVLFMPIIRKGHQVQWTSRLHIKGAMGPIPVSKASLRAIGAPDDWTDKTRTFLDALQSEYSALPGGSDSAQLPPGEESSPQL